MNMQQATLVEEHWSGAYYHDHSDQQKMVADLLIKQFTFKPTDHILDVGCGDGKITSYLGFLVPFGSVIGVDPSEQMYQFAQKQFGKGNISFIKNKASEVDFENQFDVITSFSALHWEPNQQGALKAFHKALKWGGSLLLAIPGPDMTLRVVLREIIQDPSWKPYFVDYSSPGRVWTPNEYAALLLEQNFQIRKIAWVDRPYSYENDEKYIRYIAAMLPHLARLPEDRKDEFLYEIVKGIKKKGHIDEKGHIKFDVKVIEIIAVKEDV